MCAPDFVLTPALQKKNAVRVDGEWLRRAIVTGITQEFLPYGFIICASLKWFFKCTAISHLNKKFQLLARGEVGAFRLHACRSFCFGVLYTPSPCSSCFAARFPNKTHPQ